MTEFSLFAPYLNDMHHYNSSLFGDLQYQDLSGAAASYIWIYYFSFFIDVLLFSLELTIFFLTPVMQQYGYFIVDSYQQGQVFVSGYWILLLFFFFPCLIFPISSR